MTKGFAITCFSHFLDPFFLPFFEKRRNFIGLYNRWRPKKTNLFKSALYRGTFFGPFWEKLEISRLYDAVGRKGRFTTDKWGLFFPKKRRISRNFPKKHPKKGLILTFFHVFFLLFDMGIFPFFSHFFPKFRVFLRFFHFFLFFYEIWPMVHHTKIKKE